MSSLYPDYLCFLESVDLLKQRRFLQRHLIQREVFLQDNYILPLTNKKTKNISFKMDDRTVHSSSYEDRFLRRMQETSDT